MENHHSCDTHEAQCEADIGCWADRDSLPSSSLIICLCMSYTKFQSDAQPTRKKPWKQKHGSKNYTCSYLCSIMASFLLPWPRHKATSHVSQVLTVENHFLGRQPARPVITKAGSIFVTQGCIGWSILQVGLGTTWKSDGNTGGVLLVPGFRLWRRPAPQAMARTDAENSFCPYA